MELLIVIKFSVSISKDFCYLKTFSSELLWDIVPCPSPLLGARARASSPESTPMLACICLWYRNWNYYEAFNAWHI